MRKVPEGIITGIGFLFLFGMVVSYPFRRLMTDRWSVRGGSGAAQAGARSTLEAHSHGAVPLPSFTQHQAHFRAHRCTNRRFSIASDSTTNGESREDHSTGACFGAVRRTDRRSGSAPDLRVQALPAVEHRSADSVLLRFTVCFHPLSSSWIKCDARISKKLYAECRVVKRHEYVPRGF